MDWSSLEDLPSLVDSSDGVPMLISILTWSIMTTGTLAGGCKVGRLGVGLQSSDAALHGLRDARLIKIVKDGRDSSDVFDIVSSLASRPS